MTRWWSRPLWCVLAMTLGSDCELAVNLDPLGDQKCPDLEKACPTLKRCVSISEPETGCANPLSCAPCPVPEHVSARCTNSGECMISGCIPPYGDCDATVPGCETDLAHDPRHCNACDHVCETANGYPGCSAGNCQTGGCLPHFDDCDGHNGCEADLLSSGEHCGRCDRACLGGTRCVEGTCQ